MFQQLESNSFLFRLFIGSLIVAAGFLFLPFLLSSSDISTVEAQSTTLPYDSFSVDSSESSNVVATGFASMTNEVRLTAHQVKDGATKSTQTLRSSAATTAEVVTNSTIRATKITLRGIGSGVGMAGSATTQGLSFIINIPGRFFEVASSAPLISNLLRPSDHQAIPIIDPDSPELLAALTALPPETPISTTVGQSSNNGPQWPIHGRITTQFGVNHRPYQDTHTGIDISDGQKSGVTSIKPFRPGKVIEVTYSKYGYGNHVIIDHGNNVTSVYAHLASIAVRTGQEVELTTVIGKEGTTGLSTGTHLHFEVRVNGKAADPHKFISGQP